MFTDTEVGLIMRHNREMSSFTADAQRLVDRQDREIAKLRRQLSAAQTDAAELRREKGARAIDELLAIRALKKRRAAH